MDMTANMDLPVVERIFTCPDGIKLAAQCFPPQPSSANESSVKVLMLHGWMDNCRTFWTLAPSLQKTGFEIVALDIVGHGQSDHKCRDGPATVMAEACYYVAEVMRQLDWKSACIVGHSMGGAIGLLYAAAFPEQCERLVFLDSLGPLTKPPQQTSKTIRKHVEKRAAGNRSLYNEDKKGGPRIYPSLDAAVAARLQTVAMFPGNQTLSKEAAVEMVQRATKPADEGVVFRHDPRLHWPSILFMTDEQVGALQRDVQCPSLVVLAENGIPFEESHLARTKETLQPQKLLRLPGCHHFHADPETAGAVLHEIKEFLTKK